MLETTNLISFLLEENNIEMVYKGGQKSIEDKIAIICQGLKTMNEMCTGSSENRKIICENKRFFKMVIQKCITDNKILPKQEVS